MTRQEALQTLQVYTKAPNLVRHHLAVEAAMRAICKIHSARTHNFENEEMWAIAGLLHDADYELTRNTPERHTLYLEEKIGKALPKEVLYAIKAHNYKYTKATPISAMDWALYTCDELTGFVIAAALIQKDKKISSVTVEFILKKLGEPSFAKSVDRAQIQACEQSLKIPLDQYVGIVLAALQGIATDLGFEA
ncbi:MAG: phosphohydrolase [Candidatus Levybacteria bacterium]|nr:phosphohydrolase [Candidatus Levybacteria bacterium]